MRVRCRVPVARREVVSRLARPRFGLDEQLAGGWPCFAGRPSCQFSCFRLRDSIGWLTYEHGLYGLKVNRSSWWLNASGVKLGAVSKWKSFSLFYFGNLQLFGSAINGFALSTPGIDLVLSLDV